MEANTRAIVRLAWCRQLRLDDDALGAEDASPTPILATAEGRVTLLRLWDDVVLAGPDWLHERARGVDPAALGDPHTLVRLCEGHPVRLLGTQTLAYTDAYVALDGLSAVPVADDPETVARLESACPPDDVTDVGLGARERVFVTLDDRDEPTAGAGYDEWVHVLGDVAVLTPPALRRSGFGTRAAALAVNDALDVGLVPQWRAPSDHPATQRTARRLGLVAVGSQTAIVLAT